MAAMQLQLSASWGEGRDSRLKHSSQEKRGQPSWKRLPALSQRALFKARQLLISVGQESRQPGFPAWGVNATRALTVTFNPAVMAAGRLLCNGEHG